jgi:hypothetical protein
MDDPPEKAKRELKMYRSILEMLKGNTADHALKSLEHRWLDPLLDKIWDLSPPAH